MRHTLIAAVALLSLAAAPAFAATTVDGSSFNTAGPGVVSEIQPGLTFAARNHAVYRSPSPVATASIDQTNFNTQGPGATNSLNGRAVPASGYGVPANLASRKPGDAQSRIATQATSGADFNTSGPGAVSGLNPGLTTAGHARLARSGREPARS